MSTTKPTQRRERPTMTAKHKEHLARDAEATDYINGSVHQPAAQQPVERKRDIFDPGFASLPAAPELQGEVELKPCPFCNNAISRKITMRATGLKVRRDDVAYLGNAPWIVLCLDCGANGANKETRQEAIDAWNDRATPPAADAEESEVRRRIAGRGHRSRRTKSRNRSAGSGYKGS